MKINFEYKVRNNRNAKAITTRHTSRIEVFIEGRWFIAARVRRRETVKEQGKTNFYQVEIYNWPNMLHGKLIQTESIEDAQETVKQMTGLTFPKAALLRLESLELMKKMNGRRI